MEAELPVSQPEAACARPVLPPVAELPDAARVPAYSAVPRAGVRCARAAQRVWFQDGSAPVVVSPALELAGLPQDALALSPDDSALAVPQADARYAQAVQQALPVQRDGSVALPPDDSAAPPE